MSAAPQSARVTAAPLGSFRRELGATLALGWPIILANVAIYAMTATDFIMLGRLSAHALAAGALGFNLFQPEMVLGIGVVAALAPIAAAKIGSGESGEALRRATHQSLLSAIGFSAVAWIYLLGTEQILRAIGESPDLARDAGIYMRGYQWSLLPNLLFITARCIFSALERPRPTLIAGVIGVAFNALANYALVFGKLGMPALGIIGSGIATTLSQSLMFLILLSIALVEPRLKRIRPFALPWRPARRELAALWRLGLPMGAMILAEVGVFAAATMVMGLIGRPALEAHTAALQIVSIAFMVPLGLGQAATVRVGLAYGARNARAIAHAGWCAFGLTLAYAALSATAMIAAPRLLIAPFIDVDAPENATAVATAVAMLKVAALFQVFDASQVALANMLRGLHDSKWPFVIALLGYWAIGAPIGLALGFLTPLGGIGVWIGLATGLIVVAFLLLLRWVGKERRAFAV
ncbi:MAG TPA: MATE family efflux transporter [Roseiarcus sp.]|jgi:MATE family multidrug resistance protein